jgi:hypothetical protein
MEKNLLQELKELFPVEIKSGQDINPIVFGLIKQGVKSAHFFDVDEKQIRKILESVPNIFPENGRIKEYRRMPYKQKRVYKKVAEIGGRPCFVEVIGEVINQGIKLKSTVDRNFKDHDDEFCRKENKPVSAFVA